MSVFNASADLPVPSTPLALLTPQAAYQTTVTQYAAVGALAVSSLYTSQILAHDVESKFAGNRCSYGIFWITYLRTIVYSLTGASAPASRWWLIFFHGELWMFGTHGASGWLAVPNAINKESEHWGIRWAMLYFQVSGARVLEGPMSDVIYSGPDWKLCCIRQSRKRLVPTLPRVQRIPLLPPFARYIQPEPRRRRSLLRVLADAIDFKYSGPHWRRRGRDWQHEVLCRYTCGAVHLGFTGCALGIWHPCLRGYFMASEPYCCCRQEHGGECYGDFHWKKPACFYEESTGGWTDLLPVSYTHRHYYFRWVK